MRKSNIILVVLLFILLVVLLFVIRRNAILHDEVEIQKDNVRILKGNETIYKICDSIKVAEIYSLQLEKSQFEELIKAKDKQIAQIKAERKKDIEYYTRLAKTDTFIFDHSKIDTIYVNGDTCVGYEDQYLSFYECPNDVYFQTRDTIKQVISKEYKHKFLWFKWGFKGISQDVWSTNPHSNIHFDEFVKIK